MKSIHGFKRKPEKKSQNNHKTASEPYFFYNFSHFCQDVNVLINQKNNCDSQKY